MSSLLRSRAWALAASALGSVATAQSSTRLESIGAIEPDAETAAHVAADLDGDGRTELVLASRDGAIRVWQLAGSPATLTALGSAPLRLPDPEHSLLALADVVGDARLELTVLGRRGAVAWSFDPAGGFVGEPIELASTGRLGARLGAPTFGDFVRDVNADGLGDLIVPVGAAAELWLRQSTETGEPSFERTQVIPVDIERERSTRADLLSSRLSNRIEISSLNIVDVNGDDRPDLRVEDRGTNSFFLQQDDGRFTAEPITVDLSKFRDTTPQADVELGDTAVFGDTARIQSGDLNADGITDYVIAHRRKLWTFLATPAGPQFTRAKTRMVAEDITGLLLVHLDDDDAKDLLIFKVTLPSAADLVLGFVASIDISVTALGYRTGPGGVFEDRARWRRTLTLRVPSIVRLLGEADDLAERFMDVLGKFRWSALGDYDGDGTRDLALLTEDETAVELWRKPQAARDLDRAGARWFKNLLFDDPNTTFDVERILVLAAQVFDVRTAAMTGERAADARADLPPRDGRYLIDVLAADLDGDGSAELILVDDDESGASTQEFAVYRWIRR